MTQPTDDFVILEHLFEIPKLNKLDWKPFREAVDQYPLYVDKTVSQSGPSAKLLRLHPGCKIPFHVHSGFEFILTLDGSQQDRSGRSRPGTILINKPNSGHLVMSESGSIVLGIYEKPVCFCNEADAVQRPEFRDEYVVVRDIFAATTLNGLVWQPSGTGIAESLLCPASAAEASGASAKFMRLDAGATQAYHEHTGFEHMVVIEGSIIDQGRLIQPGTIVVHGPSTAHEIVSETGCTLLAIYEKQILGPPGHGV